MRRELFRVLALAFVLLTHVFVASGALHDHLDAERPGECVSCGAASQTLFVHVESPLVLAPSNVAPLRVLSARPPARPFLVPLDARGPPTSLS